MRERTPLPPSEQRALERLEATFGSDEKRAQAWEDARALLTADGYTEASADDLLQSLENRGYIYTVDGDVRLTG